MRNGPPSVADATVLLIENSANGTVVHTVSAADPEGDVLTYAITSGNRNNAFVVNNDGVITVSNSSQLDFETSPVFVLTVQVTDGKQSAEARVTINLQDINEAPSLEDAIITIAQNLPTGTMVYKFVSVDPDVDDTSVFSIEAGDPNSAFMLNENAGELFINDTEQFNLLVNPVFKLIIRVRDSGGLSATANLTIHLEGVDGADRINPLKGFSPDGDGINDFWMIKGIELFPENEVKVFNRWGNLVFETKNYNNDNVAWHGFSTKSVAETTYFFLISIKGMQPITGYVVLKE